jgi:hypothetical protein
MRNLNNVNSARRIRCYKKHLSNTRLLYELHVPILIKQPFCCWGGGGSCIIRESEVARVVQPEEGGGGSFDKTNSLIPIY